MKPRFSFTITATALLASLLLAACSRESGPAPATARSTSPAMPAAVVALEKLDAGTLRARAQAAMEAHRVFAPAGDNALEYSLALRNQSPDDPGARTALVDLEPELVIAIEQSVARDAFPEARRLLGLLERVDAAAPALPRLRDTIATTETAARARALAAEAEAQVLAETQETALRTQAEAQATAPASARTAAPPAAPVAPPASTPSPPAADATTSTRNVSAAPPATDRAPPAAAPAVAVAAPAQRPAAPVSAPRLLLDVKPQYPVAERGRALRGTVQVAFTIGASGEVQAPRVLSSTLPKAFERAALQAAGRWKFEATGQDHPGSRTVAFAPVSR